MSVTRSRTFLRSLGRLVLIVAGAILVAPLILVERIEFLLSRGRCELVFDSVKELLSLAPTLLGSYLRSTFYWAACEHVPPTTRLLLGSMIAHRATRIGRRCVVGAYSIIGSASLGDDVLVGSHCIILSGKGQHTWCDDHWEYTWQERRDGRVTIGDRCWIGDGAIVMDSIGDDCIVGAGAVVRRALPPRTVVAGNPARKSTYWPADGAPRAPTGSASAPPGKTPDPTDEGGEGPAGDEPER